jgi:hypothetical protein
MKKIIIDHDYYIVYDCTKLLVGVSFAPRPVNDSPIPHYGLFKFDNSKLLWYFSANNEDHAIRLAKKEVQRRRDWVIQEAGIKERRNWIKKFCNVN